MSQLPPNPYAAPPQVTPPPGAGPGLIDAIIPTNPLAAAACWTGVLSLLVCGVGAVLGPPAVVMGVLSLKRGALMEQSKYGKTTSTARSWIGIITGGLGTVVGLAFLIYMVVFAKRH